MSEKKHGDRVIRVSKKRSAMASSVRHREKETSSL